MSHCFDYTVQVNPLLKKEKLDPVYLRAVKNNLQVKPGEPAQLQFTLIDPETMKPRDGIRDVEVTVLLAEGLRQMRFSADPVGGAYTNLHSRLPRTESITPWSRFRPSRSKPISFLI